MKVIIAGGRDFHDYDTLLEAVMACPFDITEVVSGGAPGVDTLGERFSLDALDKEATRFPANWTKYGRHEAGKIRNAEMANYAEAILALWNGFSSGTGDMIDKARAKGLLCFVWDI